MDPNTVLAFHLPRYFEIPDVGLYLKQVVKYINDILCPLGLPEMTASMISNYVKQGLIDKPVRKQYDRALIANIMVVAFSKSILSMDDIRSFSSLLFDGEPFDQAYDDFCAAAENALTEVTQVNEDHIARRDDLIQAVVRAGARQVYLNDAFQQLKHS